MSPTMHKTVTVFRATGGRIVPVDTYFNATLDQAQYRYANDYLHDDPEGTDVLFVGGGEWRKRTVQVTKSLA